MTVNLIMFSPVRSGKVVLTVVSISQLLVEGTLIVSEDTSDAENLNVAPPVRDARFVLIVKVLVSGERTVYSNHSPAAR